MTNIMQCSFRCQSGRMIEEAWRQYRKNVSGENREHGEQNYVENHSLTSGKDMRQRFKLMFANST